MRKRGIRIQVWLNKDENTRLHTSAQKAGLSQESYLRTLINGYVPKELPPPDYFSMMRELHAIGSNLNQLATKANATGHIGPSSNMKPTGSERLCWIYRRRLRRRKGEPNGYPFYETAAAVTTYMRKLQ